MKRTNSVVGFMVVLVLGIALFLSSGSSVLAADRLDTIAGAFTTVREAGTSSWVVSVRSGDSAVGFIRWRRTFEDGTATRVRSYDAKYANIHVNAEGKQEGWVAATLVSDTGSPLPPEPVWFVGRYVDGGQPGSDSDYYRYSPEGQDEVTARNAVENWTAEGLASWRSTVIDRGNIEIRSF